MIRECRLTHSCIPVLGTIEAGEHREPGKPASASLIALNEGCRVLVFSLYFAVHNLLLQMILFERESRIVRMKAANAGVRDRWNNTKVFGRTVYGHP